MCGFAWECVPVDLGMVYIGGRLLHNSYTMGVLGMSAPAPLGWRQFLPLEGIHGVRYELRRSARACFPLPTITS